MVWYRGPGPTATHYWTLNHSSSGASTRRILDEDNVAYKKSSSSDRLAVLFSQHQRGLPCYDKSKIQDLRAFCKARKLVLARGQEASRSDLVSTLESADDDRTFGRFMDLPPELRVIVYTFHIENLHACDRVPNQPPLLKVSRLVRRESLPLFYKLYPFCMDISTKFQVSGPQTTFIADSDVRFIQAASTLVYSAGLRQPAQPLGHLLTRLCVRGNLFFKTFSHRWEIVLTSVTFEIKDGELRMQVAESGEYCVESEAARAEFRRRAERLLELFKEPGRVKVELIEEDQSKSIPDRDENTDAEEEVARMTESLQSPRKSQDPVEQEVLSGAIRQGKKDRTRCTKIILEDGDLLAIKALSFAI